MSAKTLCCYDDTDGGHASKNHGRKFVSVRKTKTQNNNTQVLVHAGSGLDNVSEAALVLR